MRYDRQQSKFAWRSDDSKIFAKSAMPFAMVSNFVMRMPTRDLFAIADLVNLRVDTVCSVHSILQVRQNRTQMRCYQTLSGWLNFNPDMTRIRHTGNTVRSVHGHLLTCSVCVVSVAHQNAIIACRARCSF